MPTNFNTTHPKFKRKHSRRSSCEECHGERSDEYKDTEENVAEKYCSNTACERKDPKGVEYAEEAHRLSPFNPNVLDTLDW
mgnify:CR=1 FL=1